MKELLLNTFFMSESDEYLHHLGRKEFKFLIGLVTLALVIFAFILRLHP